MSRTPVRFVVEGRDAGRRALRALSARVNARSESPGPRRWTWFDTFDWRLYHDGGLLSAAPAEGGWLLAWTAPDGSPRGHARAARPPGFARDLPEGALRDALAPVIEMRRLLPVVAVRMDGPALRVLDEREKTVARAALELAAASDPAQEDTEHPLPPRLRVEPVVGYDAAYDEVVRVVERELGLGRDDTDDLTRALGALGHVPGTYSSKLAIELDAGERTDRAVRHILRTLLGTVRANEDGVRRDVDSEFLHDFRVAVRRARSCLGQIKDVFPAERLDTLRAELKWLGGVTGPTRDMDVWLMGMDEYRADLPGPVRADLAPLGSFLERHQRLEQGKLAEALLSERYLRLVRDWEAFVDEPPAAGGDAPANAARPIRAVAAERIARCRRRVLDKGRAIDDDSPAEKLHRLRIECKKLRYLLEFFRSLYEPGDLEPAVKSLKRLQDHLGELNDLHVQRETLARFARELSAEGAATVECLLAMGRLVERLEARQADRRSRFRKCFAGFDDAEAHDRFRRMTGAPSEASA